MTRSAHPTVVTFYPEADADNSYAPSVFTNVNGKTFPVATYSTMKAAKVGAEVWRQRNSSAEVSDSAASHLLVFLFALLLLLLRLGSLAVIWPLARLRRAWLAT